MRTPAEAAALEKMFESFCKKVLKNRNYDLMRKQKRLAAHEVSLGGLYCEPFAFDDYFGCECEFVMPDGGVVTISDEALARALCGISPHACRIVLLSSCLSLSDRQIAEALGMKRSTVQYQRSKALLQLRELIESYYDEEV